MTTLAHRLREARLSAGLSQRDLARASGVASQTICLLEQGRRGAQAETLRLLCVALAVSSDWMLGLTEEREGATALLQGRC